MLFSPIHRNSLRIYGIAFICFLFLSSGLDAHEVRPAYWGITQMSDSSYEVIWKIPKIGDRIPILKPVFPSDFVLDENSAEHVGAAYLVRYTGHYGLPLNGQVLLVEGIENGLIDVWVNIQLLDGQSYALMLQPNQPKAQIPLKATRWGVAKQYLILGIEHILIGFDHLLFVLGLMLLIPSLPKLIQTITAFTLAHSITLALAALQLFSLPQAPVEACIALSIVFLAKEYLSVLNDKPSYTAEHPWLVALSFGLLHGFGFAGALREIGFPQLQVPTALVSFNVGVEVGQLMFVAVLLLVYVIWKRINAQTQSWPYKILPYAIGSIGMFWLIERVLGFWT